MLRFSSSPKQLGTWRFVLALLCVLLVVACGMIQAVHVHPSGDVFHSDCALCASAHLTAQAVPPAVMLLVVPVFGLVETVAPRERNTSFSTFALFTRPPPVDTASV